MPSNPAVALSHITWAGYDLESSDTSNYVRLVQIDLAHLFGPPTRPGDFVGRHSSHLRSDTVKGSTYHKITPCEQWNIVLESLQPLLQTNSDTIRCFLQNVWKVMPVRPRVGQYVGWSDLLAHISNGWHGQCLCTYTPMITSIEMHIIRKDWKLNHSNLWTYHTSQPHPVLPIQNFYPKDQVD